MKLAIDGGTPVRQGALPIFRLEIEEDEFEAVRKVLASGQISRGTKPQEFEKAFREYVGANYGVVVSSGTAALHLAVKSLELPPGSEIITTSLSFVASAFAMEYCGLKPVFVDIEPEAFNLDPQKLAQFLEARISNNDLEITNVPKAVIPVHYGGRPCDMAKIKKIADEFGLKVIEDAAHAVGASFKEQGSKVGSCEYSDLTCFSFFATKNITGGEGGMITTNNEDLAANIRKMKAHGIVPLEDSPKTSGYYDVRSIGYNYHLSNLNIGLLMAQLPKLEDLNKKRKQNAGHLNELLGDLEEVHCPSFDDGYDHVYHLYSIRVDLDRVRVTRDDLVDALLAEGIQVGIYYRPIHLFSYFRKKYGYKEGDLLIAERVCESIITLPMYPLLAKTELEKISEAVHKVIEYYRA